MIRQAAPKGKEVVLYARSASRSFLSAIMQTIRDPAGKTECTLVYRGGEQCAKLVAEKARGRKGRQTPRRPRPHPLPGQRIIIAVHGRLQELRGSRGSKFRPLVLQKGLGTIRLLAHRIVPTQSLPRARLRSQNDRTGKKAGSGKTA
jgi:hypothetical protein